MLREDETELYKLVMVISFLVGDWFRRGHITWLWPVKNGHWTFGGEHTVMYTHIDL